MCLGKKTEYEANLFNNTEMENSSKKKDLG